MNVSLSTTPLSAADLAEFEGLSREVFGDDATDEWLASLAWRLENMPDVTLFFAEQAGKRVGFKAGYATAYNRYYSWLGGVVPSARRQGVARALMRSQHDWLLKSRFHQVESHVEQDNAAMINANLKAGLIVAGFFLKDGKPYTIMQKATPTD